MQLPAEHLEQKIFNITSDQDFEDAALGIFRFQAENCHIYRDFIKHLGIRTEEISSSRNIPFLPIAFFKTHSVLASGRQPEVVFSSSGTTGTSTSNHYVAKVRLYEESFLRGFRLFYGDPKQYCILALLPGYLERSGSSLIYMMDSLIRKSENPSSGFYLHEHEKLESILMRNEAEGQKTLLLGVSFALLDFLENRKFRLKHSTILETGGMKGRRKEIIREELHDILKHASGLEHIHSEYGMTELLSQAYLQSEGKFRTPPWMKLQVRETTDPLSPAATGKTGGLNVIDLANIYSCSFIATQDLGRESAGGGHEILGRFDNSDIRGCNLMV